MQTQSSKPSTSAHEILPSKFLTRDWHNARADFDRAYIVSLIIACDGNVSAAANRACLDRGSFYRKMRKLGITLEDVCANHGLTYRKPTPCIHTSRVPAVTLPPPPAGFEYYRGQLKRVLP